MSKLEEDLQAVFTVTPMKGMLDFDEEMMLKFTFSPYMVGEYDCKIPIYLEENPNKVYQYMHLKGVGAKPRLLFDRRQVIMPVVPLGQLSKATFKIINDGYENLIVTYNVDNL